MSFFLVREEEEEEEEGAGAEVVMEGRVVGATSDLKEGEEEEEEGARIGRGKEEETSLPSFSWRQKAQIPPGLFL